jgi:uncharacterized protein
MWLGQPEKGLARAVVEFCRFARDNGLGTGTGETIDALQALTSAQITGVETLKFALRAVLSSSKEEWDLFDGLFDRFWGREPDSVTHTSDSGRREVSVSASAEQKGLRSLRKIT